MLANAGIKNIIKRIDSCKWFISKDIFSKHGVDKEQLKGKLSEEKKQILKEMVEALTKRVDQFVSENNAKKWIVNFLKVPIPRRFFIW